MAICKSFVYIVLKFAEVIQRSNQIYIMWNLVNLLAPEFYI